MNLHHWHPSYGHSPPHWCPGRGLNSESKETTACCLYSSRRPLWKLSVRKQEKTNKKKRNWHISYIYSALPAYHLNKTLLLHKNGQIWDINQFTPAYMSQFSLYAYATTVVTTTTTLAFPVPILLIQDCCINLLYRKTWHRYDFSE